MSARPPTTWDAPVDRAEAAIGFRVTRKLEVRGGYQYDWRSGGRVRERLAVRAGEDEIGAGEHFWPRRTQLLERGGKASIQLGRSTGLYTAGGDLLLPARSQRSHPGEELRRRFR